MHHHHHHEHNLALVVLSFVIAIFASYTALDVANSVSRGKIRWPWLAGGSLAMGVGIWSMHFVGMLAFSLPGIDIYYDVPLLTLSIIVAIFASGLTLFIVSQKKGTPTTYFIGSLTMGAAIAGMHYIGIASMRLAAEIKWDLFYVIASILIAIVSSFVALALAFRLKDDYTLRGFGYRGAGGAIMGVAISGMHYTAMMAMEFIPTGGSSFDNASLLATDGLAAAVIVGTLIILGIALTGSNIDRALSKRTVMNDILKEAIRGRDEFLSIASHELKTPLTSIKLQVQMVHMNMKKELLDQARVERMLEQADKSVDRITRLVDDMLDISRISNGKLKLQREEFNLSELLTDITERLAPVLKEAGCEVSLVENKNIVGKWDKFRIEQIITNLLTNSARYGKGKPVVVKLDEDQEKVVISVKDHGIGISKEDQERIFQKFERATSGTEERGLGLGLFIVQELVRMHSGTISVVSALNEGSEFTVVLPKLS